ncbi:MAG TPA: hypothetical protein VNF99_15785 [Stellaceae bacterium]|nr:hypothetical protein [Stellaceae bacterium]
MTGKLAAYAAIIALSTASIAAAQAASRSNPAQDRSENQITAQLNRQQAQARVYGVASYRGFAQSVSPNPSWMREQIALPPDADDLSLIE